MKARRIPTAAILTALAASSVLALGACGSSSGSSSGGGSGEGGVKPKVAVVSIAGSEYFSGYSRGFEHEAEELDLEINLQNAPGFEASSVAATIEAAVASNPEYLLAPAIDSAALRQPLLAASERGIKIITYDTQVDDPTFVTTFVNADYTEYGRRAAVEMGRLTGGKGKVQLDGVVPGNSAGEALEDGFAEALPPGMTDLPVQYSQGENSKANAIFRALLTREPELTGIVAASAFGGEGVIAALRESGRTGEVKAILLSATKFAIEALRRGEVQVVVAESLEGIGAAALKAAYDDANGKNLPKKIIIPLCTITAKTIDDPKNAPCIQ
jgi:ribose transport system substrate-binding protein